MDKQSAETSPELLGEAFKGNLRIRLHRFRTDAGSYSHMVEVAAWNTWAGQGKIIYAMGGIDLEPAKDLAVSFVRRYRGYDWIEGDLVPEDGK